MSALDNDRWSRDVDPAVQRFLDRANTSEWQAIPGDLAASTPEPWADPDCSDAGLDAAYRAGIVPPDQRWASDFTYRPRPAPAGATILTALGGRVLTKRIYPDRIVDYDRAARFDMVRYHVRNLDGIEALLRWLAGQPDRCVIRGAIASGRHVERDVPRWLRGREGGPATIAETERQWLAVDIDEYPDEATLKRAERRISEMAGTEHRLPQTVAAGDLVGAAWVATSVLPAAFYSTACLVQATGSHGLKPGLRVRLWFWLDRAVTTAEVKFWFRHSPVVDPSVFTAAQCIFTAAPVFADSATDPVPERLVRIPGRPAVKVPPAADLRPKPKPQAVKPNKPKAGISPRGERVLDAAERTILGARRGQQEPALVRQAYRVGRVVAAGDLPSPFARAVLLHIAQRMPNLDPAWPWTAAAIDDKVTRAFAAGLRGGQHV